MACRPRRINITESASRLTGAGTEATRAQQRKLPRPLFTGAGEITDILYIQQPVVGSFFLIFRPQVLFKQDFSVLFDQDNIAVLIRNADFCARISV